MPPTQPAISCVDTEKVMANIKFMDSQGPLRIGKGKVKGVKAMACLGWNSTTAVGTLSAQMTFHCLHPFYF